MLRSILSNRRATWGRDAGAVANRRTRLAVQRLEDRVNPALINSFDPVFSVNDTGAITMAANTLLRADPNDPDAAAGQAGTGTRLENNDFNMVAVDVDSVATTTNSSSADLILPAGTRVLWAGLYWGGQSISTSRNQLLFDTPAAGGYQPITGTIVGAVSGNYQGFKDVTSLVKAAGAGTYTVGNVRLQTGTNKNGGWALVVAYREPGAPARNLTVFNGYAQVNSGDSNVTATLSGFQAPPTGTVNARLGVIAHEGDRGLPGAILQFNGTTLGDPLNPPGNFFNSTITRNGSLVTTKNPDFQNQLGFDAVEVVADGFIQNGATQATINLKTNQDVYFPGMIFTEIELFAPQVSLTKTQLDVNGGVLFAGEEIEYTVTAQNLSGDSATGFVLTDPIPVNTTYVPGSLVIDGVQQTDAIADDRAGFNATGNQVVFRLGTGANSTMGGRLAIADSSTVQFRVRVNDNVANLTRITNEAVSLFLGQTTGFSLTASSAKVSILAVALADLFVTKTVDDSTANVGDIVTFTVQVGNNGPSAATHIELTDLLPSGLTFVSATPSGDYDPITGIWQVGIVSPDGSRTLVIRARVDGTGPFDNQACITAVDRPDPDPTNNCDNAIVTVAQSDLRVAKAVDNPRPNVGDVVTFTVTLANDGPSDATGVRLTDLLPTGLAFVSATPNQGTYTSSTGVWNVGSISSGAQAELILRAQVTSPNTLQNLARVSATDQSDPEPANDVAIVILNPLKADLAVTKVIDDQSPNVGDIVAYTITVNNQGPDTATGVVLRDQLSAGLTFVDASATQGAYDSGTGDWTVGTVAAGQSATLALRVRVDSLGALDNTARIADSDQFDPELGNNTATASLVPNSADLEVTKTVNNSRPTVDEVITFTITVLNNGPNTATGVTLRDLVPTGMAFESASASQGSYDSGTGEWVVGTVSSGVPATLQIQVRVIAAGTKINVARITAADQADPIGANNVDAVTIRPQQADLVVNKTVSDARPEFHEVVTFTVTVHNNGPDAATGVILTDVLPTGLEFVSADASQGGYTPSTGIWVVNQVNAGATATLTIRARVVDPSVKLNTAAISSADQFDPVFGNNSDSVTVTPVVSDVAVAKTVSNSTPNVGDVVTFTVTATNNGPDVARNVLIEDELPIGYELVSFTRSAGAFDSVFMDWSIPSLADGASATLLLQARVLTANPGSNTATILRADSFDSDSTNNTASAGVTVQQAELALTKVVDDPTPNIGDVVTFTVTLSNNGPNDATGVLLTDLLPSGLEFVSAAQTQGTYTAATGVWNVGTVANGTTATLQLRAQVLTAAPRLNRARVSDMDQFDPNTANDSAFAIVIPLPADLAITKTVDNAAPTVGEIVTFTVSLTNNGPGVATNARVIDVFPANIDLQTAVPTSGDYDPATGVWTVPSVDVGQTEQLIITGQVLSPDPQFNLAVIHGADQLDLVLSNNVAVASFDAVQADLAVTKVVDDAAPNVGETITFTVTVTNLGPDDATGVTVTDVLPSGLEFVGAIESVGNFDPATSIWTVGALASTASATLSIQATVISPEIQTNRAVGRGDQNDPNTGNNTGLVVVDPQQADLAVTKVVDNARPNVGDVVTFTITVANQGPDSATNVELTDLLPAGLTLDTFNESQGIYDPVFGVWTIGTVSPASPQTLVLQATVTSAQSNLNVATISDADQFDPISLNNEDSVAIAPQQSDLQVIKTVSDPRPNVGDVVTFIVTITNVGPDAATGVQLQDSLPAGLTLVSDSKTQGSYNSATGVWDVGTLAVNRPATLTLHATVDVPLPATNSASIAAANQFDPDTANNTASASISPPVADLAVTKSVSNATPNVGDVVTFIVSVTNAGPDDATGVVISDKIPSGMQVETVSVSQGTYNSTAGQWQVGTVLAGATATLTITARVNSVGPFTNAAVADAVESDPNQANNSASVAVTPQQADLVVTKTVDNSRPNVGDTITFTVTVTNSGPNTATGVIVQDAVPNGLQILNFNASIGAFDQLTGTWTIGTMLSGAAETLAVDARVVGPSTTVNRATVDADQFDPDRANNVDEVTVVPPQADVIVTKRPSPRVVTVGQTMFFTIDVTNVGPDTATNVVVTDRLPAGLTFVGSQATQGAYDSATGRWTVGTLASGASARLRITVRVTSAGSIANVAAATQDQFDPVLRNNLAAVSLLARMPGKGGFLAN